jgi:hypothetical protein
VLPSLPNFLVIAPPKTGTSWLAHNLRAHPGVFVPAIKEVKYFSTLHRRLDLSWYCAHFAPAEGRLAGEASPSYAALPVSAIWRVRALMPDAKLVFLMRDPVARAWSHARHAHRYGEISCADLPDGGAPGAREWCAAAANEWALLSGDYLGQLRRWASAFPPDQLFVGFYEEIAERPAHLLRRVLRFLGARPEVDLAPFPLAERVNAGDGSDPPADLVPLLRGLLGPRTAELVAHLKGQFGLEPPSGWANTLTGDAVPAPTPEPFARASDDAYVAAVGLREATFCTAHRELVRDYRGFDLVYYRDRLFAIDRAPGAPSPLGADDATVARLLATGRCLTADSLDELKERVATRALERLESRLAAAEADARAARATADRAAHELAAALADLRHRGLAHRAGRVVSRVARWGGR